MNERKSASWLDDWGKVDNYSFLITYRNELADKGPGKTRAYSKRVDSFRRKVQFFVISSVEFASCLNLQNNLK